ncbi:PAS domain S-box protein [Leptospira idonii]|uniref:Sensor protein FixL n=1 Tax=Leptospira idonii TaxID=1193500 RepID=A0A4R9LYE7_9LEPT|nr:PAS domain S-box protein [Leptospira idonii]TGN19394.1 PAS domain S-box protein [Leptospira idonii]
MNYKELFPDWLADSKIYYATLINLSGDILYANEHFIRNFTPSGHENPKNSPFHILVHPSDRSQFIKAVQKCTHDPKTAVQFRKQYDPTHPDRWTDWELTQCKDEKGSLLGIIQVGHDLKEAKASEEKAKIETETLFRSTFEQAAAGIVHYYPSGTWIRSNKQFQELLGYSEEELKHLSFKDITHPEDYYLSENYQHELVEGTIDKYSIEKRFIRKNGNYFWGLAHVSAVHDEKNQFDYLVMVIQDLSGIKTIETRLKESEDKFEKAFFTNPAFMLISDINSGKMIEANSAWTEIFGYTLEETIGKTAIELGIISEKLRNELYDIIRKDKKVTNIELTISDKFGLPKVILYSSELFTYKDDDYVLTTGIDITERRQLQEELLSEKQRLQNILEGANVGAWEWNLTTGETLFDERWAAMLGYKLEELGEAGFNTLEKFTFEEDLERINRIIEKHIAGEIPYYEAEFRVKHKLGHTVWVLDRGKITKWSEDRKPLLMSGTQQDISDRKRYEASLIKNEIRLRTILETILDAVLIIDQKGTIQKCNLATEKTFGYHESELIGQNVNILMPEPDHSQHDQYLDSYRLTGVKRIIGYGRQITGKRKNGELFPADLAVTEWEFSGQTYFTGTIRDITNKIKVEEQLKQSQKLEALGQISGGIAHDFNNILTIVSGNLELIERKMNGAEHGMVKQIANAQKAVERGALLTQKLLAFARKQPLTPGIFEINQVLWNMSEILERVLGKHIDIKFKLNEEPLYVYLDKNDLENSILNLAINARDAMENSGNLIIITDKVSRNILPELQNSEGIADSFVEIAVIDTGRGIPPENISKIYEPFFTTKEAGRGTGLGLSTIYSFVKHFGGQIKVYSEVDVGTCFKLYLPLTVKSDKKEEPEAEETIQESGVPKKYKGKVLLVDDEVNILDIAKELLDDLGFQTVTATSAQEALEVLSIRKMDLLISDIMMPGKVDGLGLAEIVKVEYPNIKIILTSGFPGDLRKREYTDLSNFNFLNKPYKSKELEELIKQVMGK